MNFNKYLPYTLLVLFAVSACKKNSITPSQSNTDPNIDLYVSGTTTATNGNLVATYWKNGVMTKVGDPTLSTAASVTAVVGSDVYLAGSIGNLNVVPNNGVIPAYWKNGIMTKLSNTYGTTFITGMAVSGGNVYLSGETDVSTGLNVAQHWVNNAASLVIDSAAISSEVGTTVVGSDVYQAGFKFHQDASDAHGVYLKNGQVNKLPLNTIILGLTTSGSDLYFCGDYLGSNGEKTAAAYWKNGTQVLLADTTQFSNATRIAVSAAGDVYVLGDWSATAVGSATQQTYWKNGKMTSLPGATGYLSGIFVIGTDVYVTGQINGKLGYWKNEVAVTLNQYDPSDSIFITAKAGS